MGNRNEDFIGSGVAGQNLRGAGRPRHPAVWVVSEGLLHRCDFTYSSSDPKSGAMPGNAFAGKQLPARATLLAFDPVQTVLS